MDVISPLNTSVWNTIDIVLFHINYWSQVWPRLRGLPSVTWPRDFNSGLWSVREWEGGTPILSQDENDIADCINRLDMDGEKKETDGMTLYE